MSSMINTNIASLSAQRNLSKSQDSLGTALQRLSSGLRINSAKDDAAGLAISTRMTSQINGMNQAIRNANDGISLAQTADSSLDEVTNNLQRIRDLALQAANGTNSDDDRAALDVEVQQRLAEVNRIASQTTFNGINLLDGTFTSQAFQIGASANQTVTIDKINSAKASDLGLGAGTATGTALASTVATSGIAAGSLSINGTTVTTDATTNSAKALAAAINGNTTIAASGVTATATNKFSAAFTDMAVTKAGPQGTALVTDQLPAASGRLQTTTGALGTFVTTTTSTYTLNVTSATGTTAVLSGAAIGTTAADVDTALATSSVKQSLATNGITFTGSAALGTLQFSGTDIRLTEAGGDAGASGVKGFHTTDATGKLNATTSVPAGSLSINGTTIVTTASSTNSASELAAAINDKTSTTGVTAHASTTTVALGAFTTVSTAGGAGNYSLSVTSSTGGKVNLLTSAADGTTAANLDTALGTTAIANALNTAGITFTGTAAAGTLKFSSADGANLSVTETMSTTTVDGGFKTTVNGSGTASAVTLLTTGTVSLTSSSNITVDGTAPDKLGIKAGTYAGNTNSPSVTPSVTSLQISSKVVENGLATNSIKINGTNIAVTTQATTNSASAIANVINAQASTTGVFATAQATTTAQLGTFTTTASSGAGDSYGLSITSSTGGAVSIISGATNGTDAAAIDTALAGATVQANLATAGITVSGTAVAGTLKFTASDGANLKITEALGANTTGGFASTVNGASVTSTASVKLVSTSAITVANGTGTGTAADAGFTTGTYGGVAAGSLTLNGTTITTDSTTVGADKLAAAINNQSTTTGVTATALATDTGSLGSFTTSITAGYGLTVNGVKIIDSATSTAGVTAAQVDAALATTGTGTVGANLAAAGITFTGTAAGGDLHFRSAAGSDIVVAETQGGTDKTGFSKKPLTSAQQFSSTVTLSSSSAVTVGGTNPSVVGFASGTVGVVNQTGSALSSTVAASGMSAGDLSINGTTIVTSSSTNSAKALATAINDQSTTTGVTAVANATQATNLGQFKAITGYGSYTLQVGGVTVANVSDTHATHVDAAYIDNQLTSGGAVATALSGAGITVSGSAQDGTLKFTSANGNNIAITEGGTAAGSSESLGSFVAVNSNVAAQTYRLGVSVGTGSTVYLVDDGTTDHGGYNATSNSVNAAYIDSQLAGSSLQNSLSAAGISFTGSAAAGTLKFTSASGQDVKITQDNGTAGVGLSASSLGAFTTVTSAASDVYSFSVTTAGGTTVDIYGTTGGSAFDVNGSAADLTAAVFDANLTSKTAALNAAGITYTGSAVGGNLVFKTADGSALTINEAGQGAGAGTGFANTKGVGNAALSSATIQMNDATQGFTNLTGGVTHAVNTKVGFTNLDTGVASTTTSSVTLNSANTITVAGNNPLTSSGLAAGKVGADKTCTLTVGDGTSSTDLTFNLAQGAFGVSVKATDVASAINNSTALQALKISAQIDANGKVEVSSSDARNITMKESTSDEVNYAVSGTNGFADTDAGAAAAHGLTATAVTHMGQVSLATTKDMTIAGSNASAAGFTAGSFGGANVLSVTAANATLTAIDTALKTISSTRASLGAYQNRFASTVANLTANAESLTSSRSRILDADFASETANLTRGQILQQAGTAMLAQANQLPNGVLALLR